MTDPKRTDPPRPEVEAMCYSRCPTPTTDEYRCPICASVTEYPLGVLRGLYALSDGLPSLAGFTLSLDTREFCRACTPAPSGGTSPATPLPRATLVARKGDREKRTPGITLQDLEVLRAYAARVWFTWLRPTPRRVRELLGL